MTTNLIERESDTTSTGGWTALGCLMFLVAGFSSLTALTKPVATDLLMGFDYDPSALTDLRVWAGVAGFAWFASFVAAVLGLRRSAGRETLLGCLVLIALVLLGPVTLFAVGFALP